MFNSGLMKGLVKLRGHGVFRDDPDPTLPVTAGTFLEIEMPLPPGIKLIALTTTVPLQLSIRDGDRGWERARAQAAEHLAYQLFRTPGLIIQKEVETSLLERTFEFSVVAMHPRTLKEMIEADQNENKDDDT